MAPARAASPAICCRRAIWRSLSRCRPQNGVPSNYAADRIATALYDFPGHRVPTHFITEMPLRASSTRGLGAYANVFAIEFPPVEVVLINRPGMPFLGTGEASQGPTGAALSNAVFDATGVRFRRLPLTPERVTSGLAARA